jgi:hypothetical protein
MINANFSPESLNAVQEMLYAEGQVDPLEGTCNQRKKREQNKTQRTPEQAQADKQRAQHQQGRDTIPSGVRSEAAKKAAETRRRCKGVSSPTTTA